MSFEGMQQEIERSLAGIEDPPSRPKDETVPGYEGSQTNVSQGELTRMVGESERQASTKLSLQKIHKRTKPGKMPQKGVVGRVYRLLESIGMKTKSQTASDEFFGEDQAEV